jgi:dolichol-phosphate mannosyltransferase
MTASANRITIVIPTYNESENIRTLVPDLLALDPRLSILIVDDGSPDGTGAIADGFSAASPDRVSVLHRTKKAGIGPAYIAGFERVLTTGADLIVTMDADYSHHPTDLPRLIAAAEKADLVLGSRYVPGGNTSGWPLSRRFISRIGGFYARAVLGVHVRDLTGGFKVFRRSALEALPLDRIRSDGYVFQIETTYRLLRRGLRVEEAPITFADRVAGKSKLSRRIVLEAMIVVWKLRFDRSI